MDATVEHPFFVYGHGWASCNPDGSIQAFGLKCQRLRVGDVVISLTPREPTSPVATTTTTPSSSLHCNARSFYHNDDTNQIPQNLSKKPETIPTTATCTTVTCRPVPPFDCHQSLAFYASYLNSSSMNAAINAAGMLATTTNNLNDERRHQATTNHHTSLLRNMHTDDGSIKSNHQHISGSNAMSTTCNVTAAKHPSVYRMAECNGSNDANFSKKRRWSATVICDDEMCRKSGQKNCNHNNHAHG